MLGKREETLGVFHYQEEVNQLYVVYTMSYDLFYDC